MKKIYLDNCSYNRPFDNQSQIKIRLETEAKLYIQAGIREKKFSMVWSYMLDYENDNNPYEEKRSSIAPWKNLADEYCSSTNDILEAGKQIMKLGIKSKDALHIACALKKNCEYFITTDKGILKKKVKDIAIVSPIGFIGEMEES